jgi:aminoglycoside phosphotransferase (APT) family kinase protein
MSEDAYVERLVDEKSLEEYLSDELGGAGDLFLSRHSGGHSNETLFVQWGDQDLVLRRPPLGETADSAHDVLREYRVMDALQDTRVRVPRTVLACDDQSVIGSDFFLMEREAGDVIRDSEPDRFASPADRRRLRSELVQSLAEIHAVDVEGVGLAELGRPTGYTKRQVDLWEQQLDWAFEVTAAERDVPALEEVANWLEDNVPASYPHTLVHGDFKLDNVMFGPDETPKIVAIFDWELCTLGDPRFDLGWLLAYWRDEGDAPPAIPELVPRFMERPAYPTRRDLVDQYESVTGDLFEHDRFYRTLAVYKLAALCEMFYRRHLDGDADNPMYPKMRDRVPALADRALRIIDGEETL